MAEYVNGYVEGKELVLLSREGGRRVETRLPAQWVAYFRRGELPPDLGRDLERDLVRLASSVEQEGDWLRVGFPNADLRRAICFERESRNRVTREVAINPLIARGVQHYEADLDPIRRYFTDTGATIARPRRLYLDIETDSRLPFSRKEEMRVLCWAVIDDERQLACGVLREWSDRAERELLGLLWEVADPYDQIVSWNGDGFDFPVVFSRCEKLDVGGDARRWLYVDQMVAFRRMNAHAAESGEEKQSMSLQNIAMATLGRGKKEFDASQTYQAWEAGGESRRRLVEYCAADVALMPDIEKKTAYLALFSTLCEVCRLFGNTSSLNPTRQMDGFLLRLAREREGVHFPSRAWAQHAEDQAPEQFKGAFVMQPKSLDPAWRAKRGMKDGILRNVHVADFASLYPSIILTWNMSAETRAGIPVNGPIPAGHCRCLKTGTGFRTDEQGLLPIAVAELIRMRKHWSDVKASLPPGTTEWNDADKRSMAYKVAANSFYGAMGNEYSRFHDRAIAEGITQNGAWLLEQTIFSAEQRGWNVVYGDTDSCFVTGCTEGEFRAFVEWCNADLYPRLLAGVGCSTNEIKLAYEKEFSTLVFCAAKKYAGNYAHYKGKRATAESKPEIKGLEFKRGDGSLLGRRLQKSAVDLLMRGVTDLEEFHSLLTDARTHALEGELQLDEIKLSKSLSKPLKEYVIKRKLDGTDGAPPAHVVVARMLEKRGHDVSEGTRVEYVVVDAVAEDPQKRVLPAADYAGEFDRHYVWETLVYPPTERLLMAAFPAAAQQWAAWARSRPPRPRRGGTAAKGQGGLFAAGETRVSPRPALPTPSPPRRPAA
jgi:DNA polymerase elongation subunit (family B)